MKATVILKPLEYTLEAIGEKWQQGAIVKGHLKIKNHSGDKVEIPVLKVVLCKGVYKKVKAKDEKALVAESTIVLDEKISVGASEEKTYNFEFKLPEDCTITDKTGSLYLAFFDKEEITPAANIELTIEPKIIIRQILEIFENFLRFKTKEIKTGKNCVEVKLIPPASREMANVDGLVLSISEVDKTLTMNYVFNLRSLDLTGATTQVEKKVKEIEQKFTSKQYMMFDSINQDFVLQSLQSVVDGIKTKLL